jgi:hypothetical protein
MDGAFSMNRREEKYVKNFILKSQGKEKLLV